MSGYSEDGNPEIGRVPEGIAFAAKASLEGDDVVLSEVKPSVWRCVEFCENTFVAPPGWGGTDADEGDDDDEGPDVWEEPVILVSRPAAPLKRPIRIAVREAVLLPMRRTLTVIRSSVRKGISEGKFRIQDDATAKFLARFDKRGYPFHHDAVFVLVTAVRVEPSKP